MEQQQISSQKFLSNQNTAAGCYQTIKTIAYNFNCNDLQNRLDEVIRYLTKMYPSINLEDDCLSIRICT